MNKRRIENTKNLINAAAFNRVNTVLPKLLAKETTIGFFF